MCHFCERGRRNNHLLDLAPFPPPARQPGSNAETLPDEPQMTAQDIRTALGAVGSELRSKRVSLTLVGVGGVLSTMVLATRRTTHDVDILCEGNTPEQLQKLRDAIQKVARKQRLAAEWLNNKTILHIPQGLRQAIHRDAMQQQRVIFDEGGLKLLAAPWMYCFVSKLHRISGGGMHSARRYDPIDAANFMLQYLQSHRWPAVSISHVKEWLNRYEVPIPDGPLLSAIREVNAAAGRQIIIESVQ